MIIFLSGKDSLRSRQQLKKMIEKFKAERDPQGMNVVSLDAEKVSADSIWQQILATPFLAERRMIVLENLLVSKQKDVQGELLARIEEGRLPESNVIILWEGTDTWKAKPAKELAGRLANEKFTQVFDELPPAKLSGWIAAEVKERGGAIDRKAVQALADHVGTDMWRLSNVMNQLISFAQTPPSPLSGGGEPLVIAVEDVMRFVDAQADDNIFTLVDAVIAGKATNVFAMMRQQYRTGKDPQFVFAMLLRQFRILLEIRDLFDREGRMPGADMAKPLGIHPFVLKKSGSLVQKYSLAELRTIYEELLDIDIKTKTGQWNLEILLDVFVGKRILPAK